MNIVVIYQWFSAPPPPPIKEFQKSFLFLNGVSATFKKVPYVEWLHCTLETNTVCQLHILKSTLMNFSLKDIFLSTEKPAISREVFENSGILITGVNNFIENIQKVAAPFRSSYW